jgi:hypothetical protein
LTAPDRISIIRRPSLTTERPMSLRKIAFAFVVLVSLPAGASAGPIEFQLTPTGFWIEPGHPMLDAALVSTFEAGTFTIDRDTWSAGMTGPLIDFDQSRLPTPRPEDLNPDGASIWRNKGNFRLDFTLTDVETGATRDLSMWGRAHGEATFANGQWMYGNVTYWFGNGPEYAELGGKDYAIWGQQRFTGDRPVMSVWVGEDPPFPWVPEPSTLVLTGISLASFGARFLRGRVKVVGVSHTPA